ncbi:MAG: FAD-dependent oxidoreductase [Lysobacterales bacterium]
MKTVVIGAGLLGITSAYFLRRHGAEVTVLEHHDQPAQGASFGNGGYCQASAPDPWNGPGALRRFAGAWWNGLSGQGDESAFVVRNRAIPALTQWGMGFFRNSTEQIFLDHMLKNRSLAQYTLKVLNKLNQQEPLDYAWSGNGGLVIFRDEPSLKMYTGIAEHVAAQGSRFNVLDRDALLTQEPSLTDIGDKLTGAVHFPDDRSGNARMFCEQLAAIAEKQGAQFHYGAGVTKIERTASGIRIETAQGAVDADRVVVAAGVHAGQLLKPLGITLPVRPAKGYSISVPMARWSPRPAHVIADMGPHIGANPLGDTLRVAGVAEFTGISPGVSARRTRYLLDLLRQVFPTLAESVDMADINPWGGHRPLSIDGLPIIGATPVKGVYVNTGHGGLGWTQAAGSSKALADHMVGEPEGFDISDYSINRFT